MKSKDIPEFISNAIHFKLGELLNQASSQSRSSWSEIPKDHGIYIVHFEGKCELTFSDSVGKAKHSSPVPPNDLQEKWENILARCPTDIVYIGKGEGKEGLRQRIKQLIRFGVGKVDNHKGGRQIWQIDQIEFAIVSVNCCEAPRCVEKDLLQRFSTEHGELPLGNQKI